MAELNEEQLLLLDNLMYYSGSADAKNKSVEQIANKLKMTAENYNPDSNELSGGFEKAPNQAKRIANEIINDEMLSSLTVVATEDSTGFRATCFVDGYNNAIVAIRGTGGSYEAWKDNVVGAVVVHTEITEKIINFIDELDYENITVTGHSKGGNLAQYVTVLRGNKIDRCVSFDGQGFSQYFIDEYREKIEKNKNKIKSINAEKDYVNILLNSIAGETVYLEGASGIDAHSSYYLWEKNTEKMKNGEFNRTVPQDKNMAVLDDILDYVVNEKITSLPYKNEVVLMELLGNIVGTIMSNVSGQYEKGQWETSKEMIESIADSIETSKEITEKESRNLETRGHGGNGTEWYVHMGNLRTAASDLYFIEGKLQSLYNQLIAVKLPGSQYISIRSKLLEEQNALKTQIEAVKKMTEALNNIHSIYSRTEKEIVG